MLTKIPALHINTVRSFLNSIIDENSAVMLYALTELPNEQLRRITAYLYYGVITVEDLLNLSEIDEQTIGSLIERKDPARLLLNQNTDIDSSRLAQAYQLILKPSGYNAAIGHVKGMMFRNKEFSLKSYRTKIGRGQSTYPNAPSINSRYKDLVLDPALAETNKAILQQGAIPAIPSIQALLNVKTVDPVGYTVNGVSLTSFFDGHLDALLKDRGLEEAINNPYTFTISSQRKTSYIAKNKQFLNELLTVPFTDTIIMSEVLYEIASTMAEGDAEVTILNTEELLELLYQVPADLMRYNPMAAIIKLSMYSHYARWQYYKEVIADLPDGIDDADDETKLKLLREYVETVVAQEDMSSIFFITQANAILLQAYADYLARLTYSATELTVTRMEGLSYE